MQMQISAQKLQTIASIQVIQKQLAALERIPALKPLSPQNEPRYIVSLTSYGKRLTDTAPYAIVTLFEQTVQPDKIILWVADEDKDKIPGVMQKLEKKGLEIRFCEDLKSYKKLIPALQEFPEDYIITADDDVYYPENWLEQLITLHKENPKKIICHRAHGIKVDDNHNPTPYKEWDYCIEPGKFFADVTTSKKEKIPAHSPQTPFPTGVGGVLYPPKCFHNEILNKELFTKLAPHNDDIWFWAMAAMNKKYFAGESPYAVVPNGYSKELQLVDPATEQQGLWTYNISEDGNDKQIKAVIEHFPQIRDYLRDVYNVQEKNREEHIIRLRNQHLKLRARYDAVLKILRDRVKERGKIRVCFFVAFAQKFAARPVFEKMLDDPIFDPFIVIIPKLFREDWKDLIGQTYKAMAKKYPSAKIYPSFDKKAKKFMDISDRADLVFIADRYDDSTHQYYKRSSYLRLKELLMIYVPYAYGGYFKNNCVGLYYSQYWLWALSSANPLYINMHAEGDVAGGVGTLVAGYCKMDLLAKATVLPRDRKCVIIAPHHELSRWQQQLAFLRHSDLFLKLPTLYPDIDFVFRPHQVLFWELKRCGVWTQEKVDKYIADIKAAPNMIYDDTPEYFDLFANSDALIHDCGSFLPEYFYTGKPQCYMLRDEAAIEEKYSQFGIELLNHTYKAFSEEQILHFIDNVVIKGEDNMKEEREKYARENIMINYPHASDKVIEYIKEQFF
jgi:hypothetical protein